MDNDQPVYENLIQTNTIMYERHGIGEIKTTNLDEDDDDDIILHEDHIYYAHVSYSSKSTFKNSFCFFQISKQILHQFKITNFVVKSQHVRYLIQH